MRRSGKTTRTVNDAIEALFKHGFIHVPSNSQAEDFFDDKKHSSLDSLNPDQVIIDPDFNAKNQCQTHLRDKIYDRLRLEHNYQFKVDKKSNKFSLINN